MRGRTQPRGAVVHGGRSAEGPLWGHGGPRLPLLSVRAIRRPCAKPLTLISRTPTAPSRPAAHTSHHQGSASGRLWPHRSWHGASRPSEVSRACTARNWGYAACAVLPEFALRGALRGHAGTGVGVEGHLICETKDTRLGGDNENQPNDFFSEGKCVVIRASVLSEAYVRSRLRLLSAVASRAVPTFRRRTQTNQ